MQVIQQNVLPSPKNIHLGPDLLTLGLRPNSWLEEAWSTKTVLFRRKKEKLHPKIKIVIFHLPPCRSDSVKALFVFRTQDILDKNREACDCPIDCQVNYTVKVHKSMKSIARILHLQQLGTVTSPLSERSAILEIIPWTRNEYTLLNQPDHKGALFAFKSV